MSNTPTDEDSPPWPTASERLYAEASALSDKLDDSMGSDFKVAKVLQKARKAERIEEAQRKDDGGWVKHTAWHWQRRTENGESLNYWPSTVKAQYMGRMYYGPRDVNALFKQLGIPA